MLTGPQQMPVFSDDVLKPEEKRDVIAYLQANEESPNYGGSALGGSAPFPRACFAWLAGIGVLVGFAVWIAAHSTRSKKEAKRERPRATPTTRCRSPATRTRRRTSTSPRSTATRSPTPVSRRTSPRPTDVDEHAERAPSAGGHDVRPLGRLLALLFCVAYFALSVGEETDVWLGMGASNLALGVTLGMALLLIGVGAIQWARKLMSDTEIVEMRHPVASLRGGPRGRPHRARPGRRGLRHRPASADPQLPARGGRAAGSPRHRRPARPRPAPR